MKQINYKKLTLAFESFPLALFVLFVQNLEVCPKSHKNQLDYSPK